MHKSWFFACFSAFTQNFAQVGLKMKLISVIYIQKRNFWCMTRGGTQQKIFHLQKVDGEQSRSQNWRKTSKFLEKKYIHLNYIYKGTALEGTQVEFWFFVFFGTVYPCIPSSIPSRLLQSCLIDKVLSFLNPFATNNIMIFR